MTAFTYRWTDGDRSHTCTFTFVRGTHGHPYSFGDQAGRPVEVHDFSIGTAPVTQALWIHVLGGDANRSAHVGEDLPVEHVSWDDITLADGFLDRINRSAVRAMIATMWPRSGPLRLPSETEWEYAARGGPRWADGLRFSGSDDIDAVAWYDRRHGDHTQPVGRKAPNQLGADDMSGNVWEWCQDVFTRDVERIPQDGSALSAPGDERVLRGGCFHNWAAHCTVAKRYEIAHDYRDGSIGLRLAFSIEDPRGT